METEVKVALITGIFGAVIAPFITQMIIPLFRRLVGLNGKQVSSDKEGPHREMWKARKRSPILLQIVIGAVVGGLLGYFFYRLCRS